MTTHVFVVDSTTFPIHLEYLFAGTGSGNDDPDFIGNTTSELHWKKEYTLASMVADAGRIRKDNLILFYLQQKQNDIQDGKFYGIFRALNNGSFLDRNDSRQYLKHELVKPLTFRTIIEPYEVYPEGVTEWEALDQIDRDQLATGMLWSLIYRKLKGGRGNTMITPFESSKLINLIRQKNDGQINWNGQLLSFDTETQRIVTREEKATRPYEGRMDEIDILPRLLTKLGKSQKCEAHLQAYIVMNIEKRTNDLYSLLFNKGSLEWLGNEVSCSVGMRRIDILISVIRNNRRTIFPIELKIDMADKSCASQIDRYIDWLVAYFVPNLPCNDIQPVLIARTGNHNGSQLERGIVTSFVDFNTKNKERCGKLRYIEFFIEKENLIFKEISYQDSY